MRSKPLALAVLIVLTVAACGSDDGVSLPSATAESTADEGDATEDTSGDISVPDLSIPGLSIPDISVPDISFTDASLPGDPAIAALAELETAQVCQLFPKGDVEAITGVALADEPQGLKLEGLGTNCIWYGATEESAYTIIAKLEFNALPWTAVKGLSEITLGSEPVRAQSCTVGGKDALCSPKDDSVEFGGDAEVHVKLGGDDDITLYTTGSGDLAESVALAELALSKLGG